MKKLWSKGAHVAPYSMVRPWLLVYTQFFQEKNLSKPKKTPTHTFNSILCDIDLFIIFKKNQLQIHLVVHKWWVCLMHFGNYVQNCVVHKSPYKLDFKYFSMSFFHFILILGIIVECMCPISSFTHINWNALQ
jgi:hypothetical protein